MSCCCRPQHAPDDPAHDEMVVVYDTIFHQKLMSDGHGLTVLSIWMVLVSSEIGIRSQMSWSWSLVCTDDQYLAINPKWLVVIVNFLVISATALHGLCSLLQLHLKRDFSPPLA